MVRVAWFPAAIADLESVRDYVAQFDPAGAEALTARLIATGESLSSFPNRGRPANGGRELTVVRPYIIRYEVVDGEVHILRIRHSARLPSDT